MNHQTLINPTLLSTEELEQQQQQQQQLTQQQQQQQQQLQLQLASSSAATTSSSPQSPSSSLLGQLQSPTPLALPNTNPCPLDPFLTSISSETHHHSQQTPQPTTHNPIPNPLPRLPKSRLIQSAQLNQAAQCSLSAVWDTLHTATNPPTDSPSLQISRNLDCLFGELHASAVPFKQDALALIWPQSIPNKTLKASFKTQRSPVYFAIRRANIAFVAEYVLYAMPGEEAYGKNDIVFACEGFLPLVLDPELVLEPHSWRLFNELKIQIYIQRLDQSGADEANSRVLPNLFVESLSSYSGLQVPLESEIEFEKLANETKEELITAGADLELLRSKHPYNKFAARTLEFLRRCASRVDQEEHQSIQLDHSEPVLNPHPGHETHLNPKKRPRPPDEIIPSLPPHPQPGPSHLEPDEIHIGASNPVDISVEQNEEEEYGFEGELGSKGRYNPYRLGRGKGPTSAPRRRWTKQEYDLLLEEVRLHSNKYDCMAQIIKRHGRNGEISEILKDQNNVSLKDKARNLTMEWQRHGYPEDKPWLKEAFARFSVKNLKRTSAQSSRTTAVESKEDEGQMNEEGREGAPEKEDDVHVEGRPEGASYHHHGGYPAHRPGTGVGLSEGGETSIQVPENIPVMGGYRRGVGEDRMDGAGARMAGGEEASERAGVADGPWDARRRADEEAEPRPAAAALQPAPSALDHLPPDFDIHPHLALDPPPPLSPPVPWSLHSPPAHCPEIGVPIGQLLDPNLLS